MATTTVNCKPMTQTTKLTRFGIKLKKLFGTHHAIWKFKSSKESIKFPVLTTFTLNSHTTSKLPSTVTMPAVTLIWRSGWPALMVTNSSTGSTTMTRLRLCNPTVSITPSKSKLMVPLMLTFSGKILVPSRTRLLRLLALLNLTVSAARSMLLTSALLALLPSRTKRTAGPSISPSELRLTASAVPSTHGWTSSWKMVNISVVLRLPALPLLTPSPVTALRLSQLRLTTTVPKPTFMANSTSATTNKSSSRL